MYREQPVRRNGDVRGDVTESFPNGISVVAQQN